MAMNHKASDLLIKICKYYLETGLTSFSSTDISTEEDLDTHLNELESNRYLIRYNDVVDSIELSEKAIAFANTFR